jgi:hypothetical protein
MISMGFPISWNIFHNNQIGIIIWKITKNMVIGILLTGAFYVSGCWMGWEWGCWDDY